MTAEAIIASLENALLDKYLDRDDDACPDCGCAPCACDADQDWEWVAEEKGDRMEARYE